MATAQEIANRYSNTEIAFIEDGVNMETREEYLDWVAKWKETYRNLSRDIALVKNMRKPYRYQYRDPKDTESKRRTKIGDNPNYQGGWEPDFRLQLMKYTAFRMLRVRQEAKEASSVRRAAQKEAA